MMDKIIQVITKQRTVLLTRLSLYVGVMATVAVAVLVITTLSVPPFITPFLEMPSIMSFDASNSVNLTWTAPGDDANIGTATAYDIRYSTSSIDESNWPQVTQVVGEPTPQVATSQASYQVTGLSPKTTYYFAIKTVDDSGNWSSLSNIASKTTACFEAWSCTEWNACVNGEQNRTCIDLNNCGTTQDKPAELQDCDCIESWTCTDWSECNNDLQTRTCTDQNACGTEIDKPSESKSCQAPEPPAACTENWSCTEWSAECVNQQQTRTCTDLNQCGTEEYKPGEVRECDVVGGPEEEPEVIAHETFIVTGVNAGSPQVKIFDQDGNLKGQFWAFDQNYKGGINVYASDLGNDGKSEIIVGVGPDYQPAVRIFDAHGNLINSFLAYGNNFKGGVIVAAGDLDGDEVAEIVTAPQSKGGPNIRIFGYRNGQYQPVIENFFAYDVRFRGGVSLAVCDLDRDYKSEIITIPRSNGGPHLRIFGYRDGIYRAVILGLMTHNPNFRGGVNLGCGDLEGNGYDQIVAAPASSGGPHIRTFGRNRIGSISILSTGFMAFHPDFRGGVALTAGDFDYDYQQEIVAAVNSQDRALIRIFYKNGTLMKEFTAYPNSYKLGINIAAGKF